jgi:DNA-binding protein HU-beta
MVRMNKTELVDAMAESADISKAAAGRALDGMIDAITESLKAGDQVNVVGFGSFSVSSHRTESTE